jgi:thioredoxin 1
MLDRLLIAALIMLAGVAAYLILHEVHLRKATAALGSAMQASGGGSGFARGWQPGKPALLYFRSDACVPCVAQARFVQQLQTEFGDRIVVEKVDADTDQAVAERYGVFTLPTTLIVDPSGRVRHANYGLTDARRLASQMEGLG